MEKFLNRWLEKGLISKEQFLDLSNDFKLEKAKSTKLKYQITLYIIGALLVGLGVFLFISANDWILELLNNLPHFVKIFILLILSIFSLYFGDKLQKQSNYTKFGSSLIFLSSLLIGGTIALVGQAYNFEAYDPFLYLIWLLCIYPLAYIFKSQAINVLSMVLFIILLPLYYMAFLDIDSTSYFLLMPFIMGGLFYALGNIKKISKNYENFALSYKSFGLFALFVGFFIFTFYENWYEEFCGLSKCSIVLPALIISLLTIVNYLKNDEKDGLATAEFIFILLSLIFMELSSLISFYWDYVAHLFIIAMIYLEYYFGIKLSKDRFVSIATKMLWFYLIYLYIRLGVNYHLGALYFVLTGVVLIIIGIYSERNKKGKRDEK